MEYLTIDLKKLSAEFGENKAIPVKYQPEILAALSHYPELKHANITFILSPNAAHPYSVKPALARCLLPKSKRRFTVTIRESKDETASLVEFGSLPFNVRVGVIGHELGHIVQYSDCGIAAFLKSSALYLTAGYKYMVERRSDLQALKHGLSEELLEFSQYFRSIPASAKEKKKLLKNYLKPTEICYFLRHPEQLRHAS